MLTCAQWVGIQGKNGLQCHSDSDRKTLEEHLNIVTEEKQLEDSGCDRGNRTQRQINLFPGESNESFECELRDLVIKLNVYML